MSKSRMKGLFKFKRSSSDYALWTKQDDKLLAAIEAGDLEKVEHLLNKKGVYPTKLDPQGHTPLHIAATMGQTGVVRLLLAHSADPQATDGQGRTALHCAVRHGHVDIAQVLIQAEGKKLFKKPGSKACNNAETTDQLKLTALHQACLGGSLECVKILLQHEAAVESRDLEGRTPLFLAAQMGHPLICMELLDKCANIDARDNEKKTALMLAAEHGNHTVVEYLVKKGADALLVDSEGHNAGWHAVNAGHLDIKEVLDQAPTRASWDIGKTPDVQVTQTPEQLDFISTFHPEEDVPEPQDINLPLSSEELPESPPSPACSEQEHYMPATIHPRKGSRNSDHSRHAIPVPIPEPPRGFGGSNMELSQSTSMEEDTQKKLQESVEAYKELEEEHEVLNEELHKVRRENSQMHDQIQNLQIKLQTGTTNHQNAMDSSVVESLQEQLREVQYKFDDEKERNQELEEEIVVLRGKVNAKRTAGNKDGDADSWADSDEDLFDSPDSKGSGTAKQQIAVLKSQVLSLTQENEQMRNKQGLPNGLSPAPSPMMFGKMEDDIKESEIQYRLQEVRNEKDAEIQALKEQFVALKDSEVQDQVRELLMAKDNENQEQTEDLRMAKDAEIGFLKEQIAYLETERNQFSEKNKEISNERDQVCGRYDDLKSDMSSLKSQVASLEAGRAAKEMEVHQLNTVIADLKGKLNMQSLVSEYNPDGQDQVNSLLTEKELLKSEVNTLRNLVDSQSCTISNLEASAWSNSIEGGQSRDLKELESLRQENERLRGDNAELRLVVESQKLSVAALGAETSKMQDKAAQVNSAFHEQLAKLKREKGDLREQLEDIKQAYELQKATVVNMGAEVEKEREVNTTLRENLVCRQTETDEMKSRLAELQKVVDRQKFGNVDLEKKAMQEAKLQQDYKRLKEESDQLRVNLEQFQQMLTSQSEALLAEQETLTKKNVKLQEERDILRNTNYRLEGELKQLKDKSTSVAMVTADLDSFKKEREELKRQNDKLQHEITNMKVASTQELKEHQTLMDNLRKQNESLREQVSEIQSRNTQMAVGNMNEMQSLRQTNSGLHKQVNELQQHLSSVIEMKNEVSQQMKNLPSMTEFVELQEANKSLEEKNTLVKSEVEKLQSELNFLRSSRVNGTTNSVDHTHGGDHTSKLKLQLEIDRLKTENEKLKSHVNLVKESVQPHLENGIGAYSQEEIEALHVQVKRLQRQMEESEEMHREVVSTYRKHLLNAVQGNIDPEVQQALQHIIQLRNTREPSTHL